MATQETVERVERSRAEQALPPRVQDPAAIARVAAILASTPSGGER